MDSEDNAYTSTRDPVSLVRPSDVLVPSYRGSISCPLKQDGWGLREPSSGLSKPLKTEVQTCLLSSAPILSQNTNFPPYQPSFAHHLSTSPTSEYDVALHNEGQQADPFFSDLVVSDDDANEAFSDADYTPAIKTEETPNSQQALPESFCPFGNTFSWRNLYDSDGLNVRINIHAKFTKAYLEDSTAIRPHHIMYRRNYFAVAVSYTLRPPTELVEERLYVYDGHTKCLVKRLYLRMRAVNDDEHGEEVVLSVFTSKRGPPINPPPLLEQRMAPSMRDYEDVYEKSTGHGLDVLVSPIHHTFSRLQFRKATDNNGVRRRGQSYYRIVVEMYAAVLSPRGEEERVKIASTISGLLLVRGRCPNSFEPYDPTNKKRKPAKVRNERRNFKVNKAKSTNKNGGRSMQQRPASAPTRMAIHQHSRRLSTNTDSSYAADASSGSTTSTVCGSGGLNGYSPVVMAPMNRLPTNLQPLVLNEEYQQARWPLVAVHAAEHSPFQPFDFAPFENSDSGYGTSTNYALDAYKQSYPAQGAQLWCNGYNMPAHSDPTSIATSTTQNSTYASVDPAFADIHNYAKGGLGDEGQPTLQRRETR